MTADTHLQYELIQTRKHRFEAAVAGEGDRLALLLHGFPECAHSFRFQIPMLARRGYRVWAVNMRGYGKSDRPRGRHAYTIDRLLADVSDLIDASGARSVLLVGHDWGGLIAWHYAMRGSRRIERLVVMNCPHPACFVRNMTPAQLRRSWYLFFFQLPWLPERLIRANDFAFIRDNVRQKAVHPDRFTDADLDVLVDNARQPGALTAMINYYRALPLWRPSQRRIARIEVPTLLVWGEQDHALGRELTHGTARYVSDLTLRFIPDASHWVQQDSPDTVNAALTAWLDRTAPAVAPRTDGSPSGRARDA